ncbi:MAG TPA: hypothetical protein VET65_07845 [Candidatus Limnocylindrales bacterium]|nr:hypothetical protein [Candidatus Limnocylindrales bacterium]
MISMAELLQRFRRAAAPPGAAAQPGIPSDRKADLSSELGEVFAAVRAIEAEAAAITTGAQREAARIRETALVEAQRIVADARAQVPAARAEAAAARRRERDREIRELMGGAENQATQVRLMAASRTGSLVERIIGDVLDGVTQAGEDDVELMGRR